jgi:hypothetical protein
MSSRARSRVGNGSAFADSGRAYPTRIAAGAADLPQPLRFVNRSNEWCPPIRCGVRHGFTASSRCSASRSLSAPCPELSEPCGPGSLRQCPWQNPYAERLIGSIRRDCLNHFVILNARHLKRTLDSYFGYYHESRTHLGLAKQCPFPRQALSIGKIIAVPRLGGLHHRYERITA